MDLQGQKLAEIIYQVLFLSTGTAGLVYGFVKQDFDFTVYTWVVTMVIALLVCVPDFPMYSAHPIKFVAQLPQEDVDEHVQDKDRRDTAGCCSSNEEEEEEEAKEERSSGEAKKGPHSLKGKSSKKKKTT